MTGRRAQQQPAPEPQGPGYEPLTYATQGRPQVPSYDGPSFRSPAIVPQADTTPPIQAPVGPASALQQAPPPQQEQPAYRVRDFSPEGRRAAISREQFQNLAEAPAPLAPPAPPVDLAYQTQGGPAIHAHSAAAPAPQETNHTLTRRELRELRAAQQEAPELRLPEAIDTILNSGPIELPTLAPPAGQSQALADAMAEFDALTRNRREAEQAAPIPSVPAAPAPLVLPTPSVPPAYASAPAPSVPAPAMPSAWDAPAPAVQPPLPAQFAPAPPPAAAQPAPSARPVGHWSVQAQLDDEEQPHENTISHVVGSGSGAITTNILVIPSVPQAADIMSPLSSTGEILVTGSIDLPRSLGSTGAHPHRVDNSDYEEDPRDTQVISTDSAPVRAIRAVSTHTSTRGVIESKRPQGNRMPTIMIIAASVLAVGVVGLLVAAVAMHLFS